MTGFSVNPRALEEAQELMGAFLNDAVRLAMIWTKPSTHCTLPGPAREQQHTDKLISVGAKALLKCGTHSTS